MEEKSGCLICGAELVYLKGFEKVSCNLCGREFEADVKCNKGHFICNSCHSMSALDYIEQSCLQSTSINPLELALELMADPRIKMHGPEHHFLVAAVLLTAYYNLNGDGKAKKELLALAKKRSEKIPGGFCGFYGNCGAGVGTGLFISLITGSTPLSGESWGQANLMTARSLAALAESGGPRCCKRDSFLSIIEAVRFLKERFEVTLELPEQSYCPFSTLNRECLGKRCRFFPPEG